MEAEDPEIVVIGGGIGGSAIAAVMAREGRKVLLLEKSRVHIDKVRGEWMAPWGVQELKTLCLYDAMIEAGGHHLTKAVSFSDMRDPEESLAAAMPLENLLPGIRGPLCLGHPTMCNVLNDEARSAGVRLVREVSRLQVTAGEEPSVSFVHDGQSHEVFPRLVIASDGRASSVRKQIGVELEYDPVGHFFSGMLIEGAKDLPSDTQWIGTEGDVHYLCFPQSETRARLYLGISPETPSRFSGKEGPHKFLNAFQLKSTPFSRCLAEARPAGPCPAYPNSDSWTDRPFAKGVVLIGDAAGHNDPINGQGLSVTLRDVRVLRDLLLGAGEWNEDLFADYAAERNDRMRRLRFMSRVSVEIQSKFTPEGLACRKNYAEKAATDIEGRSLWLPGTLMVGPEMMPPEAFTREAWEWFVGEDLAFPEMSLGRS